jgi:hypothetical protein
MSAAQAISSQRLAANRANAQLSCGPKTPEGKAKSSLNAVKTGLTGRTVLLPSEDAEAYETHLLSYWEEFDPVGVRETQLVQSLADTQTKHFKNLHLQESRLRRQYRQEAKEL